MEKIYDCKRALDINVFTSASFEEMTLCPELRKLTGIETKSLPLVNLMTIMGNIFRTEEEDIPNSLHEHFSPEKSINKNNALNIIARHARFTSPNLKYVFIRPDAIPTIRIDDLHENEVTIVHEPEITIQNLVTCPTCVGLYTPGNLLKHKNQGPLADGHSLSRTTDLELHTLLAINTYTYSGVSAICKFCPRRFNLLYTGQGLIEHAQLHAGSLLDDNIPLLEAKELLFNSIGNNNIACCLPCQRIFPSTKLFYLHVCLVEHTQRKNYCLECHACLTTDIKEHIKHEHREHATCIYSCTIADNLLSHHINNKHPNAHQLIPQPELRLIKQNRTINWEHLLCGQYGNAKFDRRFVQTAEALLSQPAIGTNIANTYNFLDAFGWRITRNIMDARKHKNHIKSEYTPNILENVMRFITKIVLIERQDKAEVTREESTRNMFTVPPIENDDHGFLEDNIRYTADLLNFYDVIFFGNCHFKYLESSENLRVLNLCTTEDSGWNFDSLHEHAANMNLTFSNFVRDNTSRFSRPCNLTIYLESSLQPILKVIPDEQRPTFLRNNVFILAFEFLRLALSVQKTLPNVCVTTSPHLLYSKFYEEELKEIQRFNCYLKCACIQLNLGFLELDHHGIYVCKQDGQDMCYRTDRRDPRPLCDFRGNISLYGKQLFIKDITNFEKEREILQSQLALQNF